jgi:hypothetical protein
MNTSFPRSPLGRFAPLAMAAALLAGCGGGGSSGGGGGGGDTTPAADAIDKYVATFVSTCAPEPSVTDATSGAALYVKSTLKAASKTNATSAALEVTYAYYNAADCSGTARYSMALSGSAFSLTVDGSTTVGGASADKVTLNQGNKLPGISGGTIILNGVKFATAYLQASATKDLWRLTGTDLFVGDTKALDAQGYPSALQATASYKKQ